MNETAHEIHNSPPVVTTMLRTRHGEKILVARDDLLTGGTKERALWGYLSTLPSRDIIYASPFSGFAQIALAYVSGQLGIRCTIIAESDPATGNFHPYTLRARKMGAQIFAAPNLGDAEELAQRISQLRPAMYRIPLGIDVPEFRTAMALALKKEWESLSERIPGGIQRLWIPVGSGTLANSFLSFLPENIEVRGLNVRVLSSNDSRIQRLIHSGKISVREADRPFHDPATELPEIPSNLFYDAKLWSIVSAEGRTGDLWWNVAG